MIPKVIHYCWFGRGPKPPEALSFIKGWHRIHPDFEIREWNEDNFDVRCCSYVQQAYERGRFAFVSDYARGEALWRHGGIYLDTDVELVGRLDRLLGYDGFIGFEHGNSVATSTMGFRPGHPLIGKYLDQYKSRAFVRPDGSEDVTTNVTVLTKLAQEAGLKLDGSRQELRDGVACLPMQVLSPMDYINYADHRDASTLAVHHYQHSWGGLGSRLRRGVARLLSKFIGPSFVRKLRRIFSRSCGNLPQA